MPNEQRCASWCLAHSLMCGLKAGHDNDRQLNRRIAEENFDRHPCFGECNSLEALGVKLPRMVGRLG